MRDVVGHLIRIDEMYRLGYPAFSDFVRSGFRLNRAIAAGAIRRAVGRSPEALVSDLEETAYERRLGPRIYPWPVPLAEVVVHGQDIRRPLGLAHSFDPVRLAAVAPLMLMRVRYPWGRGAAVRSMRFEATDADWGTGTGPVVRGPFEAIVMTLAGRRAAVEDLSGDGVASLRSLLR